MTSILTFIITSLAVTSVTFAVGTVYLFIASDEYLD